TDTENILVRNSTDPACGGGGGTGCLAFTRFEVINFTRPSCNLQSDGAITIRVEGGTPNYIVGLVGEDLTQQLFGPGPEFTFTNLSPDEGYKYNVTDGAGNFCELNYSLRVEPNVQAT